MGPALLFLLSLYHLQATILSSIVDPSKYDLNNLFDNSAELNSLVPPELNDEELPTVDSVDESLKHIPTINTDYDKTEMTFKEPIVSISIDYANNVLKLSFQKDPQKLSNKYNNVPNELLRNSLESNFMRFGKREKEEIQPATNEPTNGDTLQRYERSQGGRDARGDNFMRFGRGPKDFMRFGRTPAAAADFMRFGRNPKEDFMRFGRSQADFMRFGRSPGTGDADNYMRFGRNPKADFMRFGRNPKHDFMRFGRTQKTQRSAEKNSKSFNRNPAENFIRFGRTPPEATDGSHNFMRFGKSATKLSAENQTMPLLQKHEIREAAKILHKSEEGGDESNPVDKAIKVLFKKHKQQAAERSHETKSNEDTDNGENFDENDLDYGFN